MQDTGGGRQSLSQRMRSTSAAEFHKKQKATTQLPSLSPNNRKAPHNAFDIYSSTGIAKNTFNRLSGLNDVENTTGLFAGNQNPPKPLLLCVRCSETPNLCMKCVELECENTLTFYRKTRAAGAATLFTKAFIEAGYSKLLKFVVFRLLKNSCKSRSQVRMKKKAVVEKLFGTNLVSLPFMAWKRFTKDNVLQRRDKLITEQAERIRVLEMQNQRVTMQLRDSTLENERQKQEIKALAANLESLSAHREVLQKELHLEQQRVKALSTLAIPLRALCDTLDRHIELTLEEANVELHGRALIPIAYNLSDVLDRKTVQAVKGVFDDKSSASKPGGARKTVLKSIPNRAYLATNRVLVEWVNAVSRGAGSKVEPVSGKSLDMFLARHEDITDITDLRNGKILARVIFSLVVDRMLAESEKNRQQVVSSSSSVGSASNPSNIFLEQYSYGSWAPLSVSYEDFEIAQQKVDHAMELLSHILSVATRCLEIKQFQPMEIFSGYKDWMWHLLLSLMNAAVPSITKDDSNEVEHSIQRYYELLQMLSAREASKAATIRIHSIVDKVYTVDVEVNDDFYGGDDLSLGNDSPSSHRMKSHKYATNAKAGTGSDVLLDSIDELDVETADSVAQLSAQEVPSTTLNDFSLENKDSVGEVAIITTGVDSLVMGSENSVEEQPLRRTRPQIQPEVTWSPDTYATLTGLIDEMTASQEHVALAHYAHELIDSHNHILRLKQKVTQDRRVRDDGIRLTTDILQFLHTHFMKATDPHSVLEQQQQPQASQKGR